MSRHGAIRRSGAARAAVFVALILAAFAFRVALAFSTHDVLEWDETYYLSLAVTGASGSGLYPFIYGFPPMHLMGGIGYEAYSYVAAVLIGGPTIYALRTVSLLVSAAGIIGMGVLVRAWYGSAAGWIAAALTSSLSLFALSNTARMDTTAFAHTAWALVAVAIAFERWPRARWHLLAGLAFGLGPQAHIDVLATAAACGFLYWVRWIELARATGRPLEAARPMLWFVAGLSAGLAIYAVANILPDPASYHTMTVRVRVDATRTYSAGTGSLLYSFLDPRILWAKEAIRYGQLWKSVPRLEILLFAASLAACIARRNAADRRVLILVPSVALFAAMLLNNASPLYYIHVLPALIVPMAPLFTHGLRGESKVALHELPTVRFAVAVLVIAVLCAGSARRTLRTMAYVPPEPAMSAADIERARAALDRRCVIAGDGALYVPYFAMYPKFISLRPTEVKHGMLYYRLTDEAEYWRVKRPDAVLSPGGLRPVLAEYVAGRGFTLVEPGLWMNPEGCRSGAR